VFKGLKERKREKGERKKEKCKNPNLKKNGTCLAPRD